MTTINQVSKNTLFINTHVIRKACGDKIKSFYATRNMTVIDNTNGAINEFVPDQTAKQVGKMLTAIGYDNNSSRFGKSLRSTIKKVYEDTFYKDTLSVIVSATGGVVKVWLTDTRFDGFRSCVTGTIVLLVGNEGKDGAKSTIETFIESIAERNEYKRYFCPSKSTNTTFTHRMNAMTKIENRGGARKVTKPIEVESTITENNVATVEIKDVVNQHADIINETVDQVAALTAQVAALTAKLALLSGGDKSPTITTRCSNRSMPVANGRYDVIDSLICNL